MSAQTGQIDVVTGAAGLIGRQICIELARRGSHVIAIDAAAAVIDGVEAVQGDVSDPTSIAAVAARVAATHGHVDRFVHAAALTALTPGRGVSGELVGFDLDAWRALIDVNLTGALVCVQQFHELLLRSEAPTVLLVGSIQGLVPTLGTGAYGVSKAALTALTRQLAAELATDAITVNMIAPGTIAGDPAGGTAPDERPTPLGRYGFPNEVARAVVSVLDEPFRFMTGAVIPLDGGEHLRPRNPTTRANPTYPDAGSCPR
ncbi:MAG: SDR family NAD(P)-dependent oxidoreductase [Mycobacteriales bacterium]